MSPHINKQIKVRGKIFLRKWHRRFGLFASIFLLIITITGILLNHYQLFSLQEKYVEQQWLLDWYGIKKPEKLSCIHDSDTSLCSVGRFVFLIENNKTSMLENNTGNLVSLTTINDERYLATNDKIFLYNNHYNLIEQINFSEETQEKILSAMFFENGLLIKTTTHDFKLEIESFELNKVSPDYIPKQHKYTKLPQSENNPEILQLVANRFREQQITWLKLMQDIHSGQIFGFQGKLLNDIVGIIIILLAISGIILWKRKRTVT